MNVNPILSAYGSQVQGVQEAKTSKTEGRKPVAQGEKVQISDASKSLQHVREAVRKAPDVRVELVVEIKRKVKDGSYPLDANLGKALERMVQERVLS